MLVRAAAFALAVSLLSPGAALAQRSSRRAPFAAVRIGANVIGNTYRVGDVKPVSGGGVSGGLYLSPFWLAEFEAWFRPSNPECCTGAEQLFTLSAERLYATAGLQPYLAGGLTLLRSQRLGTAAGSISRLQVQVTAGVRVPLARRMAIDFDLRGNGGGSTIIVRPTAAAVYFF